MHCYTIIKAKYLPFNNLHLPFTLLKPSVHSIQPTFAGHYYPAIHLCTSQNFGKKFQTQPSFAWSRTPVLVQICNQLHRLSVELQRFSMALHRLSVASRRRSVALQRLSMALHRLSVAFRTLSVSFRPLSVILQRLSVALQRLSVALQRLSVALQPLSMALQRFSVPCNACLWPSYLYVSNKI